MQNLAISEFFFAKSFSNSFKRLHIMKKILMLLVLCFLFSCEEKIQNKKSLEPQKMAEKTEVQKVKEVNDAILFLLKKKKLFTSFKVCKPSSRGAFFYVCARNCED